MKYKKVLDRNNVLVAGGAGFIGSHLCDRLVRDNNVICVDNFITGSEENIDLLLKKENFKFIKHDLRELLDLTQFPELDEFKIKYQGVQQIYNLACPTSPRDYRRLPIETLETNALAIKHILDMASEYGARVVHVSTSAIYGEPEKDKIFTEDYWGFIDPIGKRSCYNEGKRFAESMVVNFGEHKHVDWAIARVFNTYGPRLKAEDGRLVPDFINRALNNRPLIIFGSPHATSTFCYVSDIVDGLIKLMTSGSKAVYNLGHPDALEISKIAATIIALTNAKSKVDVDSEIPEYIVRQGVPDITRARDELGWFPLISLAQGLEKTIDYIKAHQGVLGVRG